MQLRRTSVRAAAALVLALGITVGIAPAAWATYFQYALNAPTAENVSRVSVVGTINGGRANLAWAPSFRTYIQTTAGATLIASNYTNTGFSDVYLVHAAYGGTVSRCHWDFLGGVFGGGNLNLNCWRSV